MKAPNGMDVAAGLETTERKQAPPEGPHGVDRWTSNGYGICVNGEPIDPPEEEETEEDSL